jgi:hypothetical protein
VNARATFVPDVEAPKPMQPGQGAFNDPAGSPEAAAMPPPPFRQLARDPAALELITVRLGIVAPIALDEAGLAQRATHAAAQRRNGIHQRQQLGYVVPVRRREPRNNRNPVRVGENMMFRPGLAAIGRVRSSFFPPRSARSDALSTTARARSSWPRRRNSASNTRWRRVHTPARCHRTSRRQQVEPAPQLICGGSMFQGIPLRSTNRIPVSTARSGIGLRPAYWRSRRRRFGKSGSIRTHKSSSIRALGMCDRLATGHATVPSLRSKYKRLVS